MKGILIFNNANKNGEIDICEITLPIETHMAGIGWGMDLLRKINEHSRFRKWLLKLVLGKYAFRELIGLQDSIRQYGYSTTFSYGLENMEYHKDKVEL